jgi:hypothetical protein
MIPEMTVSEAQREVRTNFHCGYPGQIVSGVLWLVSAALATWGSRRGAILAIVIGGTFIFPATQLVLRAMGGRATLSPRNPMTRLAQQVAFMVPLNLPLAGAAALCRIHWFYPACALLVGTHYLPFVHLYGMPRYGVLAAILIAESLLIGVYGPHDFALAGWVTGMVLVSFGVAGLLRRKDVELRIAAPVR